MPTSGLGAALAVMVLLAAPVAAQQVDTLARDTTKVTTLETIEVTGSIAPTAGPRHRLRNSGSHLDRDG